MGEEERGRIGEMKSWSNKTVINMFSRINQ
jgi:hypothetical protein